MAERSGFFNALKTQTGYDKKYNARDYAENLAAIISNGVRRSKDNELRVTAAGGMSLNISVGRAWIEGYWYINDAIFTSFNVPIAPVGDRSRIDRIVLRLNKNIEGRQINLVYLTGDNSTSPVAPSLTRSGGIYEIALADIRVNPAITQISQSNIVDLRADKELCGWITTPIGYDDYFENLDAEFNDWWLDVKNKLASTTLFKKYIWSTTLETTETIITFNIPQYDPTGVDILEVFSNGLKLFKNIDYTIEESVITFITEKIAGTEINVEVYKSIDGAGLGSVNDEITELQRELSTMKNIGEYIYVCNGKTDNLELSKIAQDFLENDINHNQLTINVYGTFGATTPYAGAGTSVSRYRWFSLGGAGKTNKKVIIDFLNASEIKLECDPEAHYIGFFGVGLNIKNAIVIANCEDLDSSFIMFSATTGSIYADNCRFIINGNQGCYIANTGLFDNCKASVINSTGESYCFNVPATGLLRVNFGEYLAYSGNNTVNAAVVYTSPIASEAVVITYGMNCPTVALTSHYQKNAVKMNAGYGSINDIISNLAITTPSSVNVRGIIKVSKPDRT